MEFHTIKRALVVCSQNSLQTISLIFRRLYGNWKENLVSIVGLSLGMLVTILSVTYIIFENSYDTYHSNSDKIVAVYTRHQMSNGESATSFSAESGLKYYCDRSIPQVRSSCRIKGLTSDIKYNNTTFNQISGYHTDSEMFYLFDFRTSSGNTNAFEIPDKTVITRALAEKLFGNDNGIGQVIEISDKLYTVVAIINNIPRNSNLKFDYLIPFPPESAQDAVNKQDDIILYLLTNNEADDSDSNLNESINNYFSLTGREGISSELVPLQKLHLYSNSQFGETSGKSFLIFISVSFLILFTSIVNYINIYYARSENRVREIGIRKVNGASRISIIRLIVGESITIIILASILGSILSEILLEKFQEIISIPVSKFGPGLYRIQISIVVITLLLGLLVGILCSFKHSGIKPVALIKGSFSLRNNSNIRKVLIGLQYSISGGLITLIIIFSLQLLHLKNAEMGFEPDNRLLVDLSPALRNRYEIVKDEILKISGIEKASGRLGGFGRVDIAMSVIKDDPIPENQFFVLGYVIENDFFDTYGINIIDGKGFRDLSGRDSSKVIIDRYTADALNLEKPVGQKLKAMGMEVEVIGLVENADFVALNSQRRPRFYTQYTEGCSELTIKYANNITDIRPILENVESKLIGLDPDLKFKYRMLDEAIWELYGEEWGLYKIILICGALAIILSLTGGYSMAAFFAERRIKQNNIRRVMGATAAQITKNTVFELCLPVIVGILVSWPVVRIVAARWMENFIDIIHPGFRPYLLSLASILCLTLLTVYSVSRRAALRNPADVLRQVQ